MSPKRPMFGPIEVLVPVFSMVLALGLTLIFAGCGGGGGGSDPGDIVVTDPRLAGGDTTVFSATSNAFSLPAANLTDEEIARHFAGDAAFEAVFVTAPATVHGGLGPLFNSSSCDHCHPKDGRGRAPAEGQTLDTMLVRISVGNDPVDGPEPAPGFGVQVQQKAVFGTDPEIVFRVHYQQHEQTFADGETIDLREPTLIAESSYIAIPDEAMFSARVAPPVFGRGLLEAVPDDLLLALADEKDRDGDGISGRPNWVWDVDRKGLAIGRFGLKANAPTLLQQSAGAYVQDMGVTNSVFPVDSAFGQQQDDELGDDPELSDEELSDVVFYTRTLAVPARRDVDDPVVVQGETLFADAGCAKCHVPALKTAESAEVPGLADQVILPYTDLLLHDMGEGLADGRPDFLATGREWRTAPLWGVGLTPVVNGHMELLHDGRARGLMEAVLWHGGEAEGSRQAVLAMTAEERSALLRFLGSL